MRLTLVRLLLALSVLLVHVQISTAGSPRPTVVVFFDRGSTGLTRPNADKMVRGFASTLLSAQDLCAWVLALTDAAEARPYDAVLSPMCGESVRKRLIELGVPKDRITVLAYGDSVPWNLNQVPLDAAPNRRAEMLIDPHCNFVPSDIRPTGTVDARM
jgi:outer membrane protein OmpA-like peptidoglycan-associated protein